jgi:hypothetical protein
MSGITQITDHQERALARVTTPFKTHVEFKALLACYVSEVQALENELYKLGGLRSPATALANGASDLLTKLGTLIGAPVRGAESDALFKTEIDTQIKANSSFGKTEDLRAIALTIITTWTTCEVIDSASESAGTHSAFGTVEGAGQVVLVESAIIDTDYCTSALANTAIRFLNSAKSAGTRVILGFGETLDANDLFRLDSGPGLDIGTFYNAFDTAQ